jgi:cell division protein FtsB
MSDEPILDEEAIIARIRERLRTSLTQAPVAATRPRPPIAPDTSAEALEIELEAMRGASDVYDVRPKSYQKVLAPILLAARRVARKLVAPSLERQVSYNVANHRLVSALRAELDALKTEQQTLRRRCEELKTELEAIRPNLGTR